MIWVLSELNTNCLQIALVIWWTWGRGASLDLTSYGKRLPFQMQIVAVWVPYPKLHNIPESQLLRGDRS